ncbi:hypothetical protein J4460_03555 [Candidatus Woesearchaeota archaeon]|nr:MAG: hypothetical protein QS99_C0009G0039 [archaeon GW2011_AR4]MBS3129725.1 hypothetical protein [Candidatus Woesearchaeota archaeon]HIH37418.1 hypothetical protein [Candidatus Woesearchaeota archaeon]HIH48284.1 hypothetical protein [Candidatus Woesearchaeota archaeon]HIJ02893.1 hypothetical protein [Candidatus Woesearchaeota archaeon]
MEISLPFTYETETLSLWDILQKVGSVRDLPIILTGEGGLVKASSYDGHEEYLPESAVYSYPLIARKLANATGGLYLPSQKRPYAALTPYDDFLRIIGCNGDSPLLDALRQERQFVREHACIHSEKEKVQVTGPLNFHRYQYLYYCSTFSPAGLKDRSLNWYAKASDFCEVIDSEEDAVMIAVTEVKLMPRDERCVWEAKGSEVHLTYQLRKKGESFETVEDILPELDAFMERLFIHMKESWNEW